MGLGTLLVTVLVSFLATYLALPILIRKAAQHGFVGVDVHKPGQRKVAELGGLGILFGFAMGVFAAVFLQSFAGITSLSLIDLLAVAASVAIIGVIGLVDDLFKMRWRTKMFLPLVASVPLAAVRAGVPYFSLPLIGEFQARTLYPLVGVPVGVTGAANAVNMIAGYNGIEAGMSLIIAFSLSLIAINAGMATSAVILLALVGALLAFLRFNWYPARVFPGDTGTLGMGAVIAAAVIIGNMEKYGLLMFALHFINLAIFLWGMLIGAKLVKFARFDRGGRLVAPESFWKHYLPFAVIRFSRPTEKQVVWMFLAAQALVSAAVLALYYTGVI
jgi:UDP-N-acetylglucosamine--dolichyl-phosphate N-acetylglucosaminephosphotransferase